MTPRKNPARRKPAETPELETAPASESALDPLPEPPLSYADVLADWGILGRFDADLGRWSEITDALIAEGHRELHGLRHELGIRPDTTQPAERTTTS